MAVGLDPNGFQPDVGNPGASAGGHQYPVAAYLPAVVKIHTEVVPGAPGSGDMRAQNQLDAVPAQDLAQRVAQLLRFARQHPPAAGDQDHLAAEPTDGLRHFDADRSTTDDQQAPRDGLHAGHLAVRPHPFEVAQARDRRDERIRAARQDDVFRGVPDTVHLDGAGPREAAVAAQQGDALSGQPALLTGVGVVGDHEVAPGEHCVDINVRVRRRLACAVHGLARSQQ